MFTEPIATPARWSIRDGTPKHDGADPLVEQVADGGVEPVQERILGLERRRVLAVTQHRPVALDDTGEDLRPTDVDPDHGLSHGGGYPNAGVGTRDAARPSLPPARPLPVPRLRYVTAGCRPERSPTGSTAAAGSGERSRRTRRRSRRRSGGSRFSLRPNRRWLRWIPVAIGLFLVLVIVWALASYFQFRDGVSAAHKRLDRRAVQALDPQHGKASDILLLGTDHAQLAGRESANRSDSITLVRVDKGRHRIAYLSIPRDLRVEIPGYGTSKINAAMQVGGPALAVRTVRDLTGLPINHVVVVDFSQFESLIDKVGGIDIVVPERIVSKFDCPYPTNERCASWPGWRFAKGKQHMDGHRALIYSRVRKNALNPADTDFSRAEHNQQVLQAVAGKLTSFGTLVKLPFIGGDLLAPVATDLSTQDFLSLGWTKFRSSRRQHAALPAGRRVERRRHRPDGGEPQRDRDGDRRVGAATADARLRRVRARLRDREPDARRALATQLDLLADLRRAPARLRGTTDAPDPTISDSWTTIEGREPGVGPPSRADESVDLAEVFKALADPNRLAIFGLVCERSAEGRTADETENSISQIAAGFELTLSTVSHHLKELRTAGLIRCERVGQKVFCTPNPDTLAEIERFLGEVRR